MAGPAPPLPRYRDLRVRPPPGAAGLRQCTPPWTRTLGRPARHPRRLPGTLDPRLLAHAAPRPLPGHPVLEPEDDPLRGHRRAPFQLRTRMGTDRGGDPASAARPCRCRPARRLCGGFRGPDPAGVRRSDGVPGLPAGPSGRAGPARCCGLRRTWRWSATSPTCPGSWNRARDNPALRVLHGPSWHVWCSRRLLERIAGDASDKDLGIHLHVLESPLERAHARRTYGTDCVSYLAEIGILGPKTSLAHGTWLSESDIERCAASGTSVCHNPSCNLRLRNGIAPVARMVEAGVNVGIGMDSWGMSSDDDLLSELRLAAMLHRLPSGGASRAVRTPSICCACSP